jgi:hypothetical protein
MNTESPTACDPPLHFLTPRVNSLWGQLWVKWKSSRVNP